jgi:hypothetical protein
VTHKQDCCWGCRPVVLSTVALWGLSNSLANGQIGPVPSSVERTPVSIQAAVVNPGATPNLINVAADPAAAEKAPCLRPNDTTLTVYSGIWQNPLWPASPKASDFQVPAACAPSSLQPTGSQPGLAPNQHFHPVYSPNGLYWPYNHTALGNSNVAKAILSNIKLIQPLQ